MRLQNVYTIYVLSESRKFHEYKKKITERTKSVFYAEGLFEDVSKIITNELSRLSKKLNDVSLEGRIHVCSLKNRRPSPSS